jgi:hypothetical protein
MAGIGGHDAALPTSAALLTPPAVDTVRASLPEANWPSIMRADIPLSSSGVSGYETAVTSGRSVTCPSATLLCGCPLLYQLLRRVLLERLEVEPH